MASAGRSRDLFTNGRSIGGGENESGSIIEQFSDIDRKGMPIETNSDMMEVGANIEGYVEDIDAWVCSLEKILDDVPTYMCSRGHPGRISRIPENLREVDAKGYEPCIMSIGPYHHGKTRLQQVEMRKRLVLKCVLKIKPELTLKNFLKVIINIEPTIRSFYSDLQMDIEQFVQMLLLDSVYLVTMFCGMPERKELINDMKFRIGSRSESDNTNEGEQKDNEDKGTPDDSVNLEMTAMEEESNDELNQVKIGEHWYWTCFAHDLFLLENQLPFFLLQKIHDLIYSSSETNFLDTMKDTFVFMLTDYTKLDSNMVILQTEEVHHLLHLCHMFFRPTIQPESIARQFHESSQMFRLDSAKQLYEAGVEFEAREEYTLLDIKFDRSGKLAMPCLHVDDNTESLLRNLVALEQMKYPSLGLHVSSYVVLLLHLVTTPKDVELLRKRGIIQHHLSSDKEMMYLVNRLSRGLAFDYVEDQYSLKHVFQELKHYSERRVPRWRAWLRHRHFRNPWTAISLLAASLILLLTIVQTYYAVYSYYYPYYNGH